MDYRKKEKLYILTLFILIFTAGFAEDSLAQEEPSETKEKVKKNISLTEPIEGWSNFLETTGVEKTYEIQRGDTLYDISATLFGDPNFWPKIWSLNGVITNPHLIEPKQIVYFAGGTIAQPPQFGIDMLKGGFYTYGKEFLNPVLPPKLYTKNNGIDLPKSLSQFYTPYQSSEEIEQRLQGIKVGTRYVDQPTAVYPVTSEIVTTLPKKTGEVKQTEFGGGNGLENDLIEVTLTGSADYEIGQKLQVYTTLMKRKILKLYPLSYLISWDGEVELVKRVKRNTFIAKITKSYSLITRGASLSFEPIKEVSITQESLDGYRGNTLNKRVRIIGGDKKLKNKVILEGAVVYLNKGSRAGLEEGAIYPVTSSMKNFFTKTRGVAVYSGAVKIAKVNSNYSTAILFNVSDKISTGDGIRP